MVEKSYLEKIAKEEQRFEQMLRLNCQIIARLNILAGNKKSNKQKVQLTEIEGKMRSVIFSSSASRIYYAGLKQRWGKSEACKSCPFSKCIYL